MRKDVFVENDSGGFSLLSSSVVDRVIHDGRADDARFVSAHEVILGSLAGDASFVARVVVGEPLAADEQEQWIARYRAALDVPCGRLLVCGGFDPDLLGEWRESGEAGSVHEVAVPPGRYLVDVYTYLHTMNGRVILDGVWKQKLGAWFRRDHPGRAFPSWVAGELCLFSDEDPGHEATWEDVAAAVEAGTVEIETDTLDWVGFLFHLQPFDPEAERTEPEEGGWFGTEQGLRRPARFPLGVAAHAEDPVYRSALEPLLGGDGEDEAESGGADGDVDAADVVSVDVFSHADAYPLATIEGGPLEMSPRHLPRLYRLAWFAAGSVQPEVRVTGPNAGNFATLFDGWPGYAARNHGAVLRLGFAASGRWGALRALEGGNPDTWTYFPSGSVLELATGVIGGDEGDPAPGAMRFRGIVEGQVDPCVWKVAEAYPPVSAVVLREALALSEAAENGRRLELKDADEAQQVLDRFFETWGDMLTEDNPIERTGAALVLEKVEKSILYVVAAEAFRLRYGDVWPHDE